MSLTMIKDGLDVAVAEHRATGSFLFDSVSDLPARGSAVDWVTVGEDDLGANWAVDEVEVSVGVFNVARVTARQAGYNWTWVDASGDPLRPIAQRNGYRIWPTNKLDDGELVLGYWHLFSNWSEDDNFGLADADPLTDTLPTWEIEFVDDDEHQDWYRRKNGTWPGGLTPPVAGSGVYWCFALDIEVEHYVDPITGAGTDYYRHFAVFWEAPSLGGTQLTWLYSGW